LRGVATALLEHRAWPVAEMLCAQPAEVDWLAEIGKLAEFLRRVESEDPETGEKRKLTKNQLPVLEKMNAWLAALSGHTDDQAREAFVLAPLPFNSTKVSSGFIERIERLRAAITHRIVAEIVRWLARPADSPEGPGFLAEYARAKQTQGLLDFDDLLIRARDLVRARPDIRRELQRQYRFIIVDEFQDTDPVQAELIVHLAQEPEADADVPRSEARLTPGKLCVVGDPKQSIYRFRGADIEVYSQVAHLVGVQGICRLRTNFRSRVRIIDAVNAIFGQTGVFRSADAPASELAYQPAYQPLEPRPDVRDAATPRVLRLMPREPATDGLAARFVKNLALGRPLEAELVAAAIREIVADRWPVFDPDTRQERPARWGDVAVLYRKASNLDCFEREFQRTGVPYRVIGGKTFFEREEIVRLISVLTAIEQPGDALSVVAALRSPFFGVSDADLASAALVAGSHFDYRDKASDGLPESVRNAFVCLRELHELRRKMAPAALVYELFNRTKVLAVYAQTRNGEQAVANLLKVLDEARHLERDGPVPFRRLCEHLLALRQAGGEEGEATLDDEAGERVQMLTIHKAKGLEFPIVIAIDLAAPMDLKGGNAQPQLVSIRTDPRAAPDVALNLKSLEGVPLCSVRWRELAEADKRRDDAEAIRLLYVALTRARDYLILPKVMERRSGSWQNLIESAPEWETWDVWRPRPTGADMAPGGAAQEMPEYKTIEAKRRRLQRHRSKLREAGMQARTHYRRPSLHEEERGTADEEMPPVGVAITKPEDDQARLLGTVVHAALECLRPGDEGRVEETINRLASEHRLKEENREKALRQTRIGLAATLVRRAREAPRSWREVPVMLCEEDKPGETTITRGICDLVFEHDGGLVVVDYKTDRGGPRDVSKLVEKYRPQVRDYVHALEAATGRPVVEAWLCFLGLGDRAREERVSV